MIVDFHTHVGDLRPPEDRKRRPVGDLYRNPMDEVERIVRRARAEEAPRSA